MNKASIVQGSHQEPVSDQACTLPILIDIILSSLR